MLTVSTLPSLIVISITCSYADIQSTTSPVYNLTTSPIYNLTAPPPPLKNITASEPTAADNTTIDYELILMQALQEDGTATSIDIQDVLNRTKIELEAEKQLNLKLNRELEELRTANDAAIDNPKVVDYDTGLVQSQDGELSSAENKDEKAVDPALLQESPTFVADLVCLLIAATMAAAGAEYYKLPVFIGFIVGGMVVGPSGLNLLHASNVKYIDSLAQAGISLLLFESGVSFDRDILHRSYRMTAFAFSAQFLFIVISVPSFLSTFMDIHAAGIRSTIMFALCMALSSSTSILELKQESTHNNQALKIAISILTGQDLFMGFLLCLPDALYFGPLGIFIVMKQLIYGVALTFFSIWFSRNVLPKLTSILLDRPASKLFLMSILSLCAMFSAISTLVGLSIEFGAMTAGMILSDSELGRNAVTKLRPLIHMFSGILFASIGMLLSPRFILFHLWTILGTLITVIFIKFVSGFLVSKFSGQSKANSLAIGLSISTVAEFSMILAAKGYQLGIISRTHYLHVLAVTFLSFILSPVLFHSFAVLPNSSKFASFNPPRKRVVPSEATLEDDTPILIHRG